MEYIENSFLDKRPAASQRGAKSKTAELDVSIPDLDAYMSGRESLDGQGKRKRFRKTHLSAPRPRRIREAKQAQKIDPDLQRVWGTLPKNLEFLISFYDDKVTENYYRGNFKETREDLIRRLLDPELTLEDTSRILGVCPATVRRYTNRKWLNHHRTKGGQRRFRLSDVVKFVEAHGRFPEE